MVGVWYLLFSQEKTIKVGNCSAQNILKILNSFKRL